MTFANSPLLYSANVTTRLLQQREGHAAMTRSAGNITMELCGVPSAAVQLAPLLGLFPTPAGVSHPAGDQASAVGLARWTLGG